MTRRAEGPIHSAWPTLDPIPRVLFLDVDGTLLRATTSFLFAQRLRRLGWIERGFLLEAIYYGIQHRLGRLKYDRLLARSVEILRPIPLIELERQAYETFKAEIKARLFPGLVEHLDHLRQAGTELVLVSASPELVIRPLALYLNCRDCITTPIETRGQQVVGLRPGPSCYGPGKLLLVEDWLERAGIPIDVTAAYADNWSDRHLLQATRQAVVVRPGGRLTRLAKARGWPIVRPKAAKVHRS